MLTLPELETDTRHLLLRAISGSRADGLDTPESDTDIKGVFVLPEADFYALNPIEQLNNPSNDVVYYEWRKFVALLHGSNPNILELLSTPAHALLYRHPLLAQLRPEWLLSKQCLHTFAGYAYGQIKKARGLNKKIVNPMPQEKKTVLDFCHVLQAAATVPAAQWLQQHGWTEAHVGLVKLNHAHDVYALFVDEDVRYGFHGIAQAESNSVRVSSVPESVPMRAYLSFNHDGYGSYLREYQAYWRWVEERNEVRYQTNLAHGAAYDSKNMMHTFRLLHTALDIAKHGELRVWRDNRDDLLAIKAGEFAYEDLLQRAQALMQEVEQAFAHSHLPEQPDLMQLARVLVEVRQAFYQQ